MNKIFLIIFAIILNHNSIYSNFKIHKQLSKRTLIRKTTDNKIIQPKYIILHYTVNCDTQSIVNYFQNPQTAVSIHYIIGPHGDITMMTDPKYQAEHAGESFWQDCKEINLYSIGIELINPGATNQYDAPCKKNDAFWTKDHCTLLQGSQQCWYPFTLKQIDSLITLCQKLIKIFKINPKNIIGHSDIAPGRKTDPGPLFPWHKLSMHGLGIWPSKITSYDYIDPQEAKNILKKIGYKIELKNQNDPNLQKIIQAFQMHFRPDNIDGELDQETFNILKSISEESKTIQ